VVSGGVVVDLRGFWDEVCGLPFVAREARKLSWPDPKAGWMPGRPPSVPTLSMLYLDVVESAISIRSLLDRHVEEAVDGSLLYDVFQRSDVRVVKFGEVGFDVVVEINLDQQTISIDHDTTREYRGYRTFTTVNSDSLEYPLVLP